MSILENNKGQYLSKLLLLLLLFIVSGLAISFSISYSYSLLKGRDIGVANIGNSMVAFSLFVKQLIATIIGLLGIIYLLKTPTATLRKIGDVFALIAGIAMVYTVIFGPEINGSRRWIVIAGVSIQTGDFARLALILYLSNLFFQYHRALLQEGEQFSTITLSYKLLIRFLFAVFIYGGALYLQKDYSSLLISFLVIMSMVLVSDMPRSWKLIGVLVSFVIIILIIISNPNRMNRIFSYLNPGRDPFGSDFQLLQSYKLIQSGGLLGSGIGSRMLEVLRLPYFNNDFVFSIIVGEYGLIGALVVLTFFWFMCWYGFCVGRRIFIVDRYCYFLLLAAIVNLVVSAVAHVAVTLGITPTAGLNLPFYSSGGSSMITSLLSYGFILRATVSLYHHKKIKMERSYQIDLSRVQEMQTEQ